MERIAITLVCLFVLTGVVGFSSGCSPVSTAPPPAATTIIPSVSPTPQLQKTESPTAIVVTASPALSATPLLWSMQTGELSSTDTAYPTFTATLPPTQTLTPTKGPTPRKTRIPSPTATITTTPNPPDAEIRIIRPGLLSRVISPLKIEAMVTKGDNGFIYLALIGEDARLISSQELDYRFSIYHRFYIAPRIEFTIPFVAESARLVVYTNDLSGRIIALSSVDLVLLSIGDNEINPPQRTYESFVITEPDEGQSIQGGMLLVSGRAAPLNTSPLIFELIAEDGHVVASRQFTFPMPQGDQTHIPFVIEIPYSVEAETGVRLTVRQESANRIPGTVALSSLTIILFP